jgi:hypothetical protein
VVTLLNEAQWSTICVNGLLDSICGFSDSELGENQKWQEMKKMRTCMRRTELEVENLG